jgi:beta-lactam-binding protein with PASTA domain
MAFNVFGFLIGGALADREGIVDPASRNRVALVGGLLGSSTTGLLVTTLLVRREAEAIPPTSTTTGGLLVAVPDVTKSPVQVAQANVEKLGLQVQVQEVVSDQDDGLVIDENPTPKTLVVAGSTVTLFVSKVEPKLVTVPNVTNSPVHGAKDKVVIAGLQVQVQEVVTVSDSDNRLVIAENPAANTPVVEGSTVTLFVSKVVEAKVSVPDVRLDPTNQRPLTFVQAREILQDKNFRVTEQDEPNVLGRGMIIGTDPSAGTLVEPESEVKVRVSSGPPTTPSPGTDVPSGPDVKAKK